MEKLSFLQKVEKKSWIFITVLLFFVFLQNCSINRKYDVLKRNMESAQQENLKQIKIEGLRVSKRILYDNNAIVRTSIRPDDKMNEYDNEIKKLENK